ncbi:MAG: hypothetical protein N2116_07555, partial [Armatimonadetes bacterium]|nr:hypothetical protein [Armatimonadota bacterium]
MRRLVEAWTSLIEGIGERVGRWVVAPIRRISVWMQERLAIWILILFSIGLVAAGIALAVFMYRRQFGAVMN